MARIKEYTSRVDAAGPSDARRATGADFGAGMYEALGNVGESVESGSQKLYKRAEQEEVADLHAKMSAVHAEFTNKWAEKVRTADPSDKSLTDSFMQEYDDKLAEVQEGVGTRAGRNYFTEASAAGRAHFIENVAAGQAELAGEKAKSDYTTTLNNYSSALINQPDSFDFVKGQHDQVLENLVQQHGLSRKQAIELKTHGEQKLASDSVLGWAKLNPEYAKKQLESGRWDQYFDGDKKAALFGHIDQEIHGREVEARRREEEAKRLKEQQNEGVRNGFLKKMEDGSLSTRDVLNSSLDSFGSGSKHQFIEMIDASHRAPQKTDPAYFREMFRRINLPDGDPKKVADEHELNQGIIDGKLTYEALNELRTEFQGGKTELGKAEAKMQEGVFKSAEAALVKKDMTGLQDPVGEQNMVRFQVLVMDKKKQQRAAGKPVADLFDPSKPDYVGKYIAQFKRTPDEIIQDISANLGGQQSKGGGLAAPAAPQDGSAPPVGPPPPPNLKARKPGESVSDWRARTK